MLWMKKEDPESTGTVIRFWSDPDTQHMCNVLVIVIGTVFFFKTTEIVTGTVPSIHPSIH